MNENNKTSEYEKKLKDTIEEYNQSILIHREREHKNLLKISMYENDIRNLKRGAEESDKYIKNLETWLDTLKLENKKLKNQIKLKNKKSLL